ncbi:MAG: Fe-Mn family superoxide dismutase [Hyphomicrobiaceae bacterium]
MKYAIAPLFVRPWTLNGMSPGLIESHYEINYGGTVNRLNAITEQLAFLDRAKTPAEVIHRLKRDEFTALNSMLLHELYFASIGGDGRAVPPEMTSALVRDFGSVNGWRDEFVGLAESLASAQSAGWVLLTYVPRDGRLINHIATDDGHSIAGGIPVLALDMYEHAYHIDFGANASAYVATFMRNIEWKVTERRLLDAAKVAPPPKLVQPEFGETPAVSVEDVEEMLKSGQSVQVIDARPRHYITKATDLMDGAVWRDPERIDDWIGELDKTKPVVTFCVYGFHIGCQTASVLREKGFDAKYMSGGHYGWRAKKGAMKRLET